MPRELGDIFISSISGIRGLVHNSLDLCLPRSKRRRETAYLNSSLPQSKPPTPREIYDIMNSKDLTSQPTSSS